MVGDVVIVTDDILRRGMSSRGGWTDRQMALLGVDRRNNPGWKSKLIGSRVPAAAVIENTRMVCNAFLDLLDERNRPADGRGRFKRANKRRPRD